MMKKGMFFCLILLLGALSVPLIRAQHTEIPITVVTGIEAMTRNNLVRLTWTDSRGAAGPVYIYRSSRPFDAEGPVFAGQRPAEVPYGVESYIDDVGSSGRMYYFIAASDGDGENRYLWVIPQVNTIAVDIAGLPEAEIAAAPQPGGPGGISGLEIRPEGEGVSIRYRVNRSGNTVLYRSVQPITHTADLLSAVIVQTGVTPPFVDYPVPGIPYYYAVIFEDELIRGNVGIYPGHNAAVNPVEVKADRVGLPRAAGADLRSMPLPLMSLNYAVPGIDNFSELRNPIPLGLNAAKALGSLSRRSSGKSADPQGSRGGRAFSQDLDTESYGVSGEDLALRTIVQGSFAQGNWEASRNELSRYLSTHHSVITEARARFYRGQSLYFLGSCREAFYEFLLIRSYFPVEVNEWLEACLAILTD
jgi:hypothetical protein